jgi:hypothetical protein
MDAPKKTSHLLGFGSPSSYLPTFVESYITGWSDSEASLRRLIMNFPGELAIHWWRIRLEI